MESRNRKAAIKMDEEIGLGMRRIVALLIVISFVGAFVGTIKSSLFAQDLTSPALKKKYHPKIESVLGMLVEKYSKSRAAAQYFARQRRIPYKDNEVTVVLVPLAGEDVSAIDEVSLIFSGAIVEASSRHLLKVRIPLSALEKIADRVRGISYIRLPYLPCPLATTSEGVDLSGALAYHNSGYEGQGTKVAIIDLGFIGLSSAQANGNLPSTVITQDFTGTGIEADSDHGTAVAEIVYDMAPQAELYLIKIEDEVDLENAKDYCILEGVDIVNHSVSWVNTNFTDGTGVVCNIANDAKANGILWINAAANSAKRHYQGFFVDDDNDDWHEFTLGDETNEIILTRPSGIYVFLTWDSWPATDQDYDLYLLDDNLEVLASSTTCQIGTQPPTEAIYYLNAPAGIYHIAAEKYSASGAQELKIFTFYQDLEYQTAAHSLMAPADASGAMAVAAINQANWTTGPQENFSSRGPTNDGRTKPDISGPDRVSTFTYGTASFYGTSASSPYAAGAASLVLSAYPGFTASQLQSTLEGWAVDMGAAGKDSIYGSGRLNLALPILEVDPISLVFGEVEVPQTKTLTFRAYNTGTGTLSGTVSDDRDWITVDPTSFSGNDNTISVTVHTDIMALELWKTYTGTVTVVSNGGTKTVEISFTPTCVRVYPNPFILSQHEKLTFWGTGILGAEVRIYTLSGKLVKTLYETMGKNKLYWDGRNEEGDPVSSGIYLYLTISSEGKNAGKFAVIAN